LEVVYFDASVSNAIHFFLSQVDRPIHLLYLNKKSASVRSRNQYPEEVVDRLGWKLWGITLWTSPFSCLSTLCSGETSSI